MFILALFLTVKIVIIQNPSSIECVDKLWYNHSKDYSITVKMKELPVYTFVWMDL